jgi:TusA-related sulfurtransferase
MKEALTLVSMIFLFSICTRAQEKITMNVKDLDSDIEKYVNKNYAGYKITEAFQYDVVYEMILHREGTNVAVMFNKKGAFLYKKTDADKAKVAFQTRTSMALDDVESDITKYIKKNYEGYKLTEAYKYEEVYSTKIMKGNDAEVLLFDKEGKFIKKKEAKPAEPAAQKTDSVPPTPEMKTEPANTDSIK